MAKYKANIKFEGTEEKKVFQAGEEFEMNVKRAEEVQKNIDERYEGKYGAVLERIDNKETDNVDEDEKETDNVDEGEKETKKDDEEAK